MIMRVLAYFLPSADYNIIYLLLGWNPQSKIHETRQGNRR